MKINVHITGEVLQFQQMTGYKDGTYEVEIKNLDSRTISQNSALYLWMTMIANSLNKANVPTTQLLKADITWDSNKVKYMLVRPLLEALFSVKSTTKINKGDFDLLIDTLTKALGERGISIPDFPSIENKGTT